MNWEVKELGFAFDSLEPFFDKIDLFIRMACTYCYMVFVLLQI